MGTPHELQTKFRLVGNVGGIGGPSTECTRTSRWLLCVVSPSDSNFRKLLVGHVTLISWMLRVAAHFSNPVPEGIPYWRHACKFWLWCYSERWDQPHARMVWDWAGHVFRRPDAGLTYHVLVGFRSSLRLEGACPGCEAGNPTLWASPAADFPRK